MHENKFLFGFICSGVTEVKDELATSFKGKILMAYFVSIKH